MYGVRILNTIAQDSTFLIAERLYARKTGTVNAAAQVSWVAGGLSGHQDQLGATSIIKSDRDLLTISHKCDSYVTGPITILPSAVRCGEFPPARSGARRTQRRANMSKGHPRRSSCAGGRAGGAAGGLTVSAASGPGGTRMTAPSGHMVDLQIAVRCAGAHGVLRPVPAGPADRTAQDRAAVDGRERYARETSNRFAIGRQEAGRVSVKGFAHNPPTIRTSGRKTRLAHAEGCLRIAVAPLVHSACNEPVRRSCPVS